MSLFTFLQSANQLRRAHQTDGLRVVQDRPHELYVYTTLLIACCLSWVALFGNLNGQCGNELRATPSPGWGPRGQGPGKNNSTIHVKKSKKTKRQPCVACSMEAGADGWVTHVALADHVCSQYTSTAAYDYSWFVSFPMTHGHFR